MKSNFSYMKGVLRIKITGKAPEKFINLCTVQNIALWDIVVKNNGFFACIHLKDFFYIRPLVRKSKTRVRIVTGYGTPFIIKRMKKRKMMIAGSILFLFLLQYLLSYVWFVNISGAKTISAEKLQAEIYQRGLRPGVEKEKIDIKSLENQLLLDIPEISWVGIRFSGTCAEIEVVEKTLPKQEDKAPAHVVALKDGVILEMIALAGECVVKKGDTVKQGDILIKGNTHSDSAVDPLRPEAVYSQPVRAKGIVKARVWYENYGESQLQYAVYERTGRQEIGLDIKFGSQKFTIKKPNLESLQEFQLEELHKNLPWWRNQEPVVESIISTYHELQIVQKENTLEEAQEKARLQALEFIQSAIPESAQVLSRKTQILKTSEPNMVRVKVSVETVEDIGRLVNIF